MQGWIARDKHENGCYVMFCYEYIIGQPYLNKDDLWEVTIGPTWSYTDEGMHLDNGFVRRFGIELERGECIEVEIDVKLLQRRTIYEVVKEKNGRKEVVQHCYTLAAAQAYLRNPDIEELENDGYVCFIQENDDG